MRPTTPGIFLLFLLLAALAAPVVAVGQATGPSALWDAYPLDQAATTPAPATAAPPAAETPVPEAPPAAAPEPSGDDGLPIWAIIAGALAVLVVGGGVAIFIFARMRERPQNVTATRPPARPTEPVARRAPPDPKPAAPAPPVTAAAPPEPAPARAPAPAARGASEAALADDLELAELAAEYLWTVATGSRRPVVDLAARRFLRVGRAREMLARARARGILAGAGRGRPGGALTEKGRLLLEARSSSTGAEAPPAGPPRLRLADEENGPATGSPVELGMSSDDSETAGPAFTVLEGGARKLS
jgi:hypothetical protein